MLARINPVMAGFLASLGLVLFYFLTLGLITGDWQFPLNQFGNFKYLMTALVLGFGTQIGLWQYLRIKQKANGAGVVVSSGISGTAMVACCAHHLAEIVPILGLSGLSLVLASYQRELLILGVLTNMAGIIFMIKKIRQVKC